MILSSVFMVSVFICIFFISLLIFVIQLFLIVVYVITTCVLQNIISTFAKNKYCDEFLNQFQMSKSGLQYIPASVYQISNFVIMTGLPTTNRDHCVTSVCLGKREILWYILSEANQQTIVRVVSRCLHKYGSSVLPQVFRSAAILF